MPSVIFHQRKTIIKPARFSSYIQNFGVMTLTNLHKFFDDLHIVQNHRVKFWLLLDFTNQIKSVWVFDAPSTCYNTLCMQTVSWPNKNKNWWVHAIAALQFSFSSLLCVDTSEQLSTHIATCPLSPASRTRERIERARENLWLEIRTA